MTVQNYFGLVLNNNVDTIDKIRCTGSDGAIIKPIESELMAKLIISLEKDIKVFRESGNKLNKPCLFIF